MNSKEGPVVGPFLWAEQVAPLGLVLCRHMLFQNDFNIGRKAPSISLGEGFEGFF